MWPVVLLAMLALAVPAGAEPRVEVGAVGVGVAPHGLRALLVPVHYPIQLTGRVVEARVQLLDGDGSAIRSWTLHERLANGRIRHPDRRRRFTFVHKVGLDRGLSARVREGLRVHVVASGRLDVEGDGKLELHSRDETFRALPAKPLASGLCSNVPHLRVRPGRRISVPLPVCDSAVRWLISPEGTQGLVRTRHGRLIYQAPKRFRGRTEIPMYGQPRQVARDSNAGIEYAQITVGSPGDDTVVRALGDSVTAGFGFYSDGSSMTIGHLLECRPSEKEFDDACSSNSLNRTSKGTKVEYAPDYGLANNVSWAAQWASEFGITNYKNLAISGSEPADWAPEGEFHKTTAQIESEDPDYVLLTMGANPLLSEMLFGVDNMGCAVYADVFGGYRECIERAFAEVHLQEHLRSLYADLVKNTDATIYLMQYHLSVPSTALAYGATQIAEMGKLLNREIAAVAAEVSPQRLQVVTPPHFSVGIDISPVYPSRYTCSRLGYRVDGPSVQSDPTQDELELLHPLSFCEGPPDGESPWVISGDTGIHPS
ncbi:MAG TPA: hypothetical protein VIL21_04550, partial [Solirubrobacterales bacterium]